MPTASLGRTRAHPPGSERRPRDRATRALAFAEAWRGQPGATAPSRRGAALPAGHLRAPPAGVAAAHREADRQRTTPLLVDWVEHFFVETFSHQRDDAAGGRFIDNANARRRSLRALGRRRHGGEHGDAARALGRRIAHRPRLHAAELTRTRLRLGGDRCGLGSGRRSGVDDVVLFADLANPTSNGIYRRIGFEPVADSVRIDFAAA